MGLDDVLKKQFTEQNFIDLFEKLKKSKTDKISKIIKIPLGIDGIDYVNIDKNKELFAKSVVKRALNGKYIFTAFREVEVPKPPFERDELAIAHEKKQTRILSVCTIRDTIFQQMIYNGVYDFAEDKFKEINDCIFGYRKGKSVHDAIKQINAYIKQGYIFGIDGDITKFFDNIDHTKMQKKIETFFKDSPLTIKYLRRFIHVKTVPLKETLELKKYYNKKTKKEERHKGIPQGGVLSGLLANIYLYDFDKFVTYNLSKKYTDLKYVRYADDFLILSKTKDYIKNIYLDVKTFLEQELLELHNIDMSTIEETKPNANKTKAINVKFRPLDFLGYRLTTLYVGIKKTNLKKFKKRIKNVLEKCNKEKSLICMIEKVNRKIWGSSNQYEKLFAKCPSCGKTLQPRSWIGFFSDITYLKELKNLDKWLRSIIHFYYYKYHKQRLKKQKLKGSKLKSIFKTCVYIKEYIKKHKDIEFCSCGYNGGYGYSFYE